MNKCRNPECNKEIPDNLNYCNEQCLRRHLEIKKEQIPQNPLRGKQPKQKPITEEFKKALPESTEQLQNLKNNENNRVGLLFGSGGQRRESNIMAIKKAILTGISERTIIEEGELWFSQEKLYMYINIAKRLIEKES